MSWLIPLAAKSLVIAGGALLLLKLMQKRSAADRSWIAHLALGALLALPFASIALPALDVVGPDVLVGRASVGSTMSAPLSAIGEQAPPSIAPAFAHAAIADQPERTGAPIDWPVLGYIVPAAALLLLTLIALGRLVTLKARATVLVDAPWLTALARAQKRMGLKHGTALLTSNELPSPVSWGVIRPVIMLNPEAAQSHHQAEAIITHELAHVSRLDWAKLLLGRGVVALFWFNPLVWLLSHEARQLCEEAADDAVLATDIDGAEYASLLVGFAGRRSRRLPIGAHGVASAKNSLARRVKRVLDRAAKRAPGGWRWGSVSAFLAIGIAVPVAALNLVPATPAPALRSRTQLAQADTPDRSAPIHAVGATRAVRRPAAIGKPSVKLASLRIVRTDTVPEDPAVPPSTIATETRSTLDRTIAMKALGITADYAVAIRAAAPRLRISDDDMIRIKGAGVRPDFIQGLARLGYRDASLDQIIGAYATGVREDYVRGLASAGYGGLPLHKIIQLKAMGITSADIDRYRNVGFPDLDIDQLVQLKALKISPEELRRSQQNGL